MKIIRGDLTDPRIVEILNLHNSTARAETAPGSAHALDLDSLKSPEIDFWAAYNGNDILGVGALKQLSPDHGEVKSMHIVATGRRQGVGSIMLHHIITAAQAKGMTRLSLETGSWAYFEPARMLYRKFGFVECPPFADYTSDPNSVFMTLNLTDGDFPRP
jgi:putative acetyltransferase